MFHFQSLFFCIVCLLLPFGLFGQNEVVNGSFESYKKCPGQLRHERMDEVKAWFQPTDGSPDYYHPCGKKGSRVPENKFGHQEAYEGKAYVGMHLYVREHKFKQYKEYVMGRLKNPLIKGARYEVSFRVSRADNSKYSIDRIGAYLSSDAIQSNTWGMVYYTATDTVHCQKVFASIYPRPSLQSEQNRHLRDSSGWKKISDTITALGGEQFLLLGSFHPNNRIRPVEVDSGARFKSAYYFLDDVKVEMIGEPPEQTKKKEQKITEKEDIPSEKDSLDPGFTFELENIYFAFDKSYLKKSSRDALQKLYNFMRRHPDLYVEIQGHTDSIGSHHYNRELSERRAISVKRYLKQRGIEPARMKTQGYGKRRPLMSNNSEKGRAKNRRVMVKIIETPENRDSP